MAENQDPRDELAKIERMLRSLMELGATGEAARKPLLARQKELQMQINTAGGAVVTGRVNTGGGDLVGRDKIINNYYTVPEQKHLPHPEARREYLKHLIAAHQHLRLQGISAGSQPLSVSLEKVYVSLTAMDQRAGDRGKGMGR